MNHRKGLWIVILLTVVGSFLGCQGQVAGISPAKPKIGDEVVITYNAGIKGAALASAKAITAEMLVARDEEVPVLIEIPMKQEGEVWKGRTILREERARLLLIRFVSGEQKDDNGENSWHVMVYGTNGKPLEGSNLIRGSLVRFGALVDFKVTKDLEAAKTAMAKERELYPGNLAAMFQQWTIMMREKPKDETKESIKNELEREYGKGQENEKFASDFAYWFEQVGMVEKAAEIRKKAIEKDPKGKTAQTTALEGMYKELDAAKRASMLKKFLADFPQQGSQKEYFDNMLVSLKLNGFLEAKKFDEAYATLEAMPKKDGSKYNSLAWGMIEKGEQLEKAVIWAKRGVDLLKSTDAASKPPFLSENHWMMSTKWGLGLALDTYAYGLYQLGRFVEAQGASEEAFKLTRGTQVNINQRLVDCYVKNKEFDKAISVAQECIRKGKSNKKLVEAYKTAYVKVKGSEDGFTAAIEQSKAIVKLDMKKDILKNVVNKPAIEFALKDLDGRIVKLSDLRGKVVVLDFWATWCGPCKASFPYLQQVYEKYKSNSNVVILALNGWENTFGKDREALVKKFVSNNNFTFPVLYDEGFVEKYGVEALPTKFVIDKKGMIQFKSIGFLRGDKMIEELTTQVDMLLDDKFYLENSEN